MKHPALKAFLYTVGILSPFAIAWFVWFVLSQPVQVEKQESYPASQPIALSPHTIRIEVVEMAKCDPADINSASGVVLRAYDNRPVNLQAAEIEVRIEGIEPIKMSPTGLETNPICGIDKAQVVLAKVVLPGNVELKFDKPEGVFLLFK